MRGNRHQDLLLVLVNAILIDNLGPTIRAPVRHRNRDLLIDTVWNPTMPVAAMLLAATPARPARIGIRVTLGNAPPAASPPAAPPPTGPATERSPPEAARSPLATPRPDPHQPRAHAPHDAACSQRCMRPTLHACTIPCTPQERRTWRRSVATRRDPRPGGSATTSMRPPSKALVR